MDLENLKGDTIDYGEIWREGYLNGKLKALEEVLLVITTDKHVETE
jgi:hypothetical protein